MPSIIHSLLVRYEACHYHASLYEYVFFNLTSRPMLVSISCNAIQTHANAANANMLGLKGIAPFPKSQIGSPLYPAAICTSRKQTAMAGREGLHAPPHHVEQAPNARSCDERYDQILAVPTHVGGRAAGLAASAGRGAADERHRGCCRAS